MMLGSIPPVIELVKAQNLPIKPFKWYDPVQLACATSQYYNMTKDQVSGNLFQLIKMMKEMKTTDHNFMMWSS